MKPTTTGLLILLCAMLTGCVPQHQDSKSLSESPRGVVISKEMSAASQINVAPVELRPGSELIETTGEIVADENRIFHVNSMIGGKVATDLVSLGDHVQSKQTLATVENLEVMRISANYIHETHAKLLEIAQMQTRLKLLLSNKERLERLFSERIAAEKDVLNAQTQWTLENAALQTALKEKNHQRSEARALLAAYGVSIEDVHGDEPIQLSPILCPRSGVIVKKNITIGDVINTSEPLYVVADLSKVWLDITVFDRDLAAVKEGAKVKFVTDGLPQQEFTGKVDYIKPLAQDSRTFVARAVLENFKLRLKPGMFGRVEILEKSGEKLAFVPDSAVQSIEGKSVVFIKEPDGSFQSIAIQIHRRTSDGYFISGVNPGQPVVVRGSYYVKELLSNHSKTQEKL